MSRSQRQHLIDRAIIRGLLQCGPYACPEMALHETIVLTVTPAPMKSELENSLRHHEAERRIIGVPAETGRKWKITDEGQLWAAEHQIG